MQARNGDTIEQKISHISQLDDEKKQQFLEEWKSYLAGHPEDEKSRRVYFTYRGLQSLIDLAAAHLELNPNVEVRTTHSMDEVEDSIDSRHIDDVALAKRLPLYTACLFRSQGVLAFSNHPKVITDNLIACDKIKLDQLIQDIETVLQKWTHCKTVPVGKIMTVSFTVLISFVFLAIEIYLIYYASSLKDQKIYYYEGEQVIGPNDPHPNTSHTECHDEEGIIQSAHGHPRFVKVAVGYQHDYITENGTRQSLYNKLGNCDVRLLDFPFFVSSVVMACVGTAATVALSAGSFFCFWNKKTPTTIPKKEWEPILWVLKESVISQLPEDSFDFRMLESSVNSLHNGMTKEMEIGIFTDIVNHLKQIRHDLDVTRKPISRMPIVKNASESSSDQSSSELELEEVMVLDESQARPLLSATSQMRF